MRLWCLHPVEVLEDLRIRKVLPAAPERGEGESREGVYAWMRRQMARRIPSYQGGPLWWAWTARPDLRDWRHVFLPAPLVRMELEVPDAEVLLSNDEAWYCVLNEWYCAYNDYDYHSWDAREREVRRNDAPGWPPPPLPPAMRAEMESSWERILSPHTVGSCYASPLWQATFEFLRLENLRKVTHFMGARREEP